MRVWLRELSECLPNIPYCTSMAAFYRATACTGAQPDPHAHPDGDRRLLRQEGHFSRYSDTYEYMRRSA